MNAGTDAVVTAERKAYLIDAHAYLHRAYHALRLTTSSGRPVGALYGFARMLLDLMKREKPECVAVCFDSPGPTFRHKEFEGYKANRKEADQELVDQLALARPLAEAMGFPCVQAPGYEADDLMATLAKRAAKDHAVVLVTPDKDALQLVSGGVKVLTEPKAKLLGAEGVDAKFGVRPEQMADFLALTGDASDNVPGVEGVGPATAQKLLGRYGTLEGALEAAKAGDPGLPPKVARSLLSSEKQALLSRRLVVLDQEAPVAVDISDCRLAPVREEKLLPLLKEFEFNSIIKELLPHGAEVRSPSVPRHSDPAQDLKDWLRVSSHAAEISIAHSPAIEILDGAGWRVALGLPDGKAALASSPDMRLHESALSRLFGPSVRKVGHDLRSAFAPLARAGIETGGAHFDTWLAAYCLDPASKYDFDSVARMYGGAGLGSDPEDAGEAALDHARLAWKLADLLKRELASNGLTSLYEELELPLIQVLVDMEARGVALDVPYLKGLKEEFEGRIAALRGEINGLAGTEVNPNSPKQLGKVLFEDLKLPAIHKTPKGGISTDEETLRALAALHPLPAKLLEHRELAKLQSTYVDGLLERVDAVTRRVHTHFNQAGTSTGRLSSFDPNLQNIPIRSPLGQKIRRAFVASPGCELLSADYSQIDLRVLAHVSGDPSLVSAFQKGEDIHARTASEIFETAAGEVDVEMRRRAKAVNFGIVYGQTAHGLSQELGIPNAKAKEYIDKYFSRYAGVAAWIQSTLESARREGKVRTIFGRVRHLPDILARNTQARQFMERVAVNTPIQGSSSDIIKKAMVDIHREMARRPRRWNAALLLQVHDELLFDVPKSEAAAFGAWVREKMESAVALRVPMPVDLKAGPNWQDMRKA